MSPRYLDLLDIVDDEHVLQVLHSSLHPVVEGSCSLGVLQVKLIYRLQLLLCPLLEKKLEYGDQTACSHTDKRG